MADKSENSPKRKMSWKRKLAIGSGAGLGLLIIVYFTATSTAFFKGVVLPRAGKMLGAQVSVEDASISPFSSVSLRGFKVQTTGEPVVQAELAQARYSLWDIATGKINVQELTLQSPQVRIVQNADGTSNLDPILKALNKAQSSSSKKTSKSSKPPQLDLKNIALKNAAVRFTQNFKDGSHQDIELASVNIGIDQVRSGISGKFTLSTDVNFQRTHKGSGNDDVLQTKATAGFEFVVTPELLPQTVKGTARLDVAKAVGEFKDLSGLNGSLDCDLAAGDFKKFAVNFVKAGKNLGQMNVSGPFDAIKQEAKLKLTVSAIDRQVLNLVGLPLGLDFNGTTINATSQLELTKNGTLLNTSGQLDISRFSLTRQGKTTPTLEIKSDYDVALDLTAKNATVKTFTLDGTQNKSPLLHAGVDKPLVLSWNNNASTSVSDSIFTLAVTSLNLADWRPLLGDAISTGQANVTLRVQPREGGRKLDLQCDASVANQKQPAVKLGSTVQYNLATQDADVQSTVEVALPGTLALLGRADASATGGNLNLTAHVVQKNEPGSKTGPIQSVTGNLKLADFTGRFASCTFDAFGASLTYDIGVKDQLAQIRRLDGQLTQAGQPGGNLAIGGEYHLAKQTGQLNLKLNDLNQNGVRAFAAPALGENKLVSVAVNSSFTAKYDAKGDSSVKGDLSMTNLVVSLKGQGPKPPLSAQCQLEGAMQKSVLDLRQFNISLSPTARAKNQVTAQGKVDFSKTNGMVANLKLTADSLDVTPYYDMFDTPEAKKPETHTAAAKAPAPPPPVEPEAVKLPLQQSSLDISVGRFFLREVAVSNFVFNTKIDNNRVQVKPFQATLNGAPINAVADVNVGVPGFQYDVVLTATKIPVEPLANSFSPTYTGQAQGNLFADIRVKGAGITGENLKKNLTGQIGLSFTNANIKLVGPWAKVILTPIALALSAPELLKSPLNYFSASVRLGGGNIDIQDVTAHSDAFIVQTHGVIPIANVLNNSPLNQNVDISLPRSIMKRYPLVSVPENAAYAKLPTFTHLKGTIGEPDVKTDKLVIAGIIGGGVAGAVGGKAGNIIKGVGGILTGQSPGKNEPTDPNTKTNKGGILDLFKKK